MTLRELTIENPHKRKTDYIPIRIKIFWKTFIANYLGRPHHQIIIPETALHASWILGAQPSSYSIKKLLREYPNKKIHIVSMLANPERMITDKNYFVTANKIRITRKPWHDHSTLNLMTGKNQTVKGIIEWQKDLYDDFTKIPSKEIFYCHCMAGKARSFVETMAFIYFYPEKNILFDFTNWPKNITEKISKDLQNRLQNDPSFSDIEEFIRIRRLQVKTLVKMDGDQAGLLGLMMLHKIANDLKNITNRDEARCYKDAQNIGLMLEIPLDLGFREHNDIKTQEKNLVLVYNAYQKRKINLLIAMIIPIYENVDNINYKNDFEKNFQKMAPSKQARFAILAKKLEEKKCDLSPLRNSLYYAKIAVQNKLKLTAGDQVELLKTFGSDIIKELPTKNIKKKILNGNNLDRFNAEIQLAELKRSGTDT